MKIETARLILRPWSPRDLETLIQINADPQVMEFFPSTFTIQQSKAMFVRFETHFQEHGFAPWAVERKSDQTCIGFIGLFIPNYQTPFSPFVEIAWRLAAETWGQGYATEGAAASLKHGLEVLKLPEIVSFTAVPNLRSQRVMQKIGMTRNPKEDFNHPLLEKDHWLSHHVLYRKKPPNI